eukprot:TRINITY_DN19633_c0_g3_i1.p1 TRINITY_DN19633_c0_g3~~TRINITY_DN19633_c0_g3_i1.p1  ORF type:complete len:109 (+),score=1.20 TRINITY_DN19633_c0_g3_i1:72-398(+)
MWRGSSRGEVVRERAAIAKACPSWCQSLVLLAVRIRLGSLFPSQLECRRNSMELFGNKSQFVMVKATGHVLKMRSLVEALASHSQWPCVIGADPFRSPLSRAFGPLGS